MNDITKITKGVILHQVNCQDKMGAGVAKALYTKYPKIKEEYHKLAKIYTTPEERLGILQPVVISKDLIIYNSYSQLNYGRNPNIKYTDELLLINNLYKLDKYAKEKNLPAYVPKYIGCGLGNGNWNTIKNFIEMHTNINIV